MRSNMARCAAVVLAMCVAAGSARADDDDDDVEFRELPEAVVDTLEQEFPDAEFVEAERDTDDGRTVYDVELEGDDGDEFEVELTAEGEILEVEVDVEFDELPGAVVDALEREFPNAAFVEAERETEDGETTYTVELEEDGDEIEVELTAEGEILEVDEDD